MDGVFWHSDVGFVVDTYHIPSTFPDGINFGPIILDDILLQSPGFPKLDGAPVSSWVVARLFELTRERLGFETTEELFNDGGGIFLSLVVFTRELKPIAFLSVLGNSQHCRCFGQCASLQDPQFVVECFVSALAFEPKSLMKCRLTIVDTDPPDLPKRPLGDKHVLGWDGASFLGVQAQT